jgi:hypothetical protein
MAFRYETKIGSLAANPPTSRRTSGPAAKAVLAVKSDGPITAAEAALAAAVRKARRVKRVFNFESGLEFIS